MFARGLNLFMVIIRSTISRLFNNLGYSAGRPCEEVFTAVGHTLGLEWEWLLAIEPSTKLIRWMMQGVGRVPLEGDVMKWARFLHIPIAQTRSIYTCHLYGQLCEVWPLIDHLYTHKLRPWSRPRPAENLWHWRWERQWGLVNKSVHMWRQRGLDPTASHGWPKHCTKPWAASGQCQRPGFAWPIRAQLGELDGFKLSKAHHYLSFNTRSQR